MSIAMLAFVGTNTPPPSVSNTLLAGPFVLGALIAAAVVTTLKVRPKQTVGADPDELAPGAWQGYSLIALALSEMAAIFGFVFLRANTTMFLAACGAAMAFNVTVILPAGLAYWSAFENRSP